LKFAEELAVLNSAGTTVIADTGEEQRVGTKFAVHSAELSEVFAKQSIGLLFGELYAFSIWFTGLNDMTIADCRPMFWLM
jgi:hypothetical protein